MSATTTEVSEPASKPKPKEYGFSVLVTAFARMWRGFVPGIVAVAVNAAIQALLVLGDPVIGEGGFGVYLLALISGIVILLVSAVITATALESVHGKTGFGAVRSRVSSNIGLYSAWMIGLWVVSLIAYLLFTPVSIIIFALAPFVAVAAMDGQRNALLADLKAISARPIRWAFTIIATGIIGGILWLFSALMGFFITGVLSSFIAVFVIGFVGWWFQTAWACLYRSTPVGATDAPEEESV